MLEDALATFRVCLIALCALQMYGVLTETWKRGLTPATACFIAATIVLGAGCLCYSKITHDTHKLVEWDNLTLICLITAMALNFTGAYL